MKRTWQSLPLCAAFLLFSMSACAADESTTHAQVIAASPAEADPFMGDWAPSEASAKGPVAQVIALGGGKYQVQVFKEFDTREAPLLLLEGTAQDGSVSATGPAGHLKITGDQLIGEVKGEGSTSFTLKRTERPSPTLGAKPPEGALVMFDGKSLDRWQKQNGEPAAWKLTEDGAMQVMPKAGSIKSVDTFSDARIHLEFRSPFMPDARGQKRGNSGVYVAGVYEIQILDSYGLEGAENECGGIYKAARPRVNMCAPPLQWQTYDIDYTAPRFDADGKKVANAVVSVKHNGVSIHENLELPNATPGGVSPDEPKGPAPLFLQDHGDAVQFRNIWVEKAQ